MAVFSNLRSKGFVAIFSNPKGEDKSRNEI